ncbi:RdgB/HAM1 family non-canonical purine NTP pyrophosphatase [Synechococcus sp.]
MIFNKLVIASANAGKLREFESLLAHLPLDISAQPLNLNVEETGATFAENARLKAQAVAIATKQWALADDSGLSVDALGGDPGIHSARYAATDFDRINKLLNELENALKINSSCNRKAEFVAALAIANPAGDIILEAQGSCSGEILIEARGDEGFGYDPIFLIPELGLSYAEIDKETKATYGHRGKAFKKILPKLELLLGINPAAM